MSRSSTSPDPEGLTASGDYIQAARIYESKHRLDDAVQAYGRAGAWNDAARVLSHQGRFREAGEMLLYYLPSEPTPVRQLAPDVRRHALNAALCFARGGARREAVGLLMNLGEHQKAASLLSMAGMRQEAVRAMRGQPLEGSPWPPGVVFPLKPLPFADPEPEPAPAPLWGGRAGATEQGSVPPAFEPAPSWEGGGLSAVSAPSLPSLASPLLRGAEAGTMPSGSMPAVGGGPGFLPGAPPMGALPSLDPSSGHSVAAAPAAADVNALLEIQPPDGRLPSAVSEVLRAKWHQEPLSPRILQFLDRFVEAGSSGGYGSSERAHFYAIGRLYEYHDRMSAARKAYQVAASGSGVADAADRLRRIDEGLVETVDGRWLPLHLVVDGLHHQFASLPSLDALPVLGAEPAPAPGPTTRPDETMDFDDYMASLPPSEAPIAPSGSSGRRPPVSRSGAWISSEDMSSLDRSHGDSSDAHGPITEGSVVADRYRIDSFIGQGGMATVYKAIDMELEEAVALKVFQQVVQNRSGLERFRREMKLSRKLIHPNVVRIYEFGTWRGARYITMELLHGDDLDEYMKKVGGPLPVAQGLSLMMQACDGLGAAHKVGVIHRDVKPQNLFVVEDGKRLKVMDFGIAKVSNSASISITGVRVGTPRYMAPEQIQGGGEVGPAADLYALGGVMYEIFTGTPVFEEEELVPLLLNHMTEEPEPPSSRNPDVNAEIEAIILTLLAKNPEERFKDCTELKRELLSAYVQAERLPRR